MSTINEAIQTLQDGILLAVEKKLEQAGYDKTVRGRVVGMSSNNVYKVEINGITYSAKSATERSINDVVRVMIPQNNYSDMFILSDSISTGTPTTGGNADTVNGHTVESDVPFNLQGILDSKATNDVVTTTQNGLMTATDKTFIELLKEKAVMFGEGRSSSAI